MLYQIIFLLCVCIIGGLTSTTITIATQCVVQAIHNMIETHEQYAILKSIILIIILIIAVVLLFASIILLLFHN